MEGHLRHRESPPPISWMMTNGQLLTPLGSPNFCSCEERLRKWVVKNPLIYTSPFPRPLVPIPPSPLTYSWRSCSAYLVRRRARLCVCWILASKWVRGEAEESAWGSSGGKSRGGMRAPQPLASWPLLPGSLFLNPEAPLWILQFLSQAGSVPFQLRENRAPDICQMVDPPEMHSLSPNHCWNPLKAKFKYVFDSVASRYTLLN